jgi:hypothetical protein
MWNRKNSRGTNGSGGSWSRIGALLLVLCLVAQSLAAWPTRQAKEPEVVKVTLTSEPTVLSVEPVRTSPSQLPESVPAPQLTTLSTTHLDEQTTLLRESQDALADATDLETLRTSLEEIRNLVSILQAERDDLKGQYVRDLEAERARTAAAVEAYDVKAADYDRLQGEYQALASKKPVKQYRATIGGGVAYNSDTSQIGYSADIGVRVLGGLSLTGGAVYFPDKGFEGLTYKAGMAFSF